MFAGYGKKSGTIEAGKGCSEAPYQVCLVGSHRLLGSDELLVVQADADMADVCLVLLQCVGA